MSDAKMQIIIDGNAQGATNATHQAESAISKLTGTLKNMAIGGGALVLAKKGFDMLVDGMKSTIEFTKQCIDEAGQQESALVKLNAILKATNQYTDENSAALVENSKALQDKTTYTDEEVLASEAQLAIYKLTKDQMLEATTVITDMAAAMGTDLGSATSLVGKAMEGITTPLRRFGIILDENRLKTEGASYVLDELRSRFQGVAEAAANTADGLKKQIGNQLGELKETIGAAFLPTLKTLMEEFLHGTPIIDNFGKVIGNTKSPLERLQEFAKTAAENIKVLLDIMMNADYTSVKEGFEGISKAIGVLAGNEGVEGLTSKYQNLVDWIGKVVGGLDKSILVVGINIQIVNLFAKAIQEVLQGLNTWTIVMLDMIPALKGDQDAITRIRQELDDWTNSNKNVETAFNKLIDTSGAFINGIDEATPKVQSLSEEMFELKEAGRQVNLDAAATSIKAAGEAAGIAEGEIDSLTKTLWALYNINQGITEATWSFEDAVKNAEKVMKDKTSTDREQQEAIFGVQNALENVQLEYEKARASGELTIGMQGNVQQSFIETGIKAMAMGFMTRSEFDLMAAGLGINRKFISSELAIFGADVDTSILKTHGLKAAIDAITSKDIYINTYHTDWYSMAEVKPGEGNFKAQKSQQSGGLARNTGFIPDLGMIGVKDEAYIPAYIVRAIKENKGSFMGLDTQGGGSVSNYFNISELVVREEADVQKIAKDLYNMQVSSLRGAGIR